MSSTSCRIGDSSLAERQQETTGGDEFRGPLSLSLPLPLPLSLLELESCLVSAELYVIQGYAKRKAKRRGTVRYMEMYSVHGYLEIRAACPVIFGMQSGMCHLYRVPTT